MTVGRARKVVDRLNQLAAAKFDRVTSVDSKLFLAVAEHFIAELPLRTHKKSIASDERFIRRNLMDRSRNPFAEKPISEVTVNDVAAMVGSIANRQAHASAIAVLAKLKTIFKWAMVPPRRQSYGISADPTKFLTFRSFGLQRGFRTRFLSDAEILAYLAASDLLGSASHRALARCLILRGLPASKLAGMRWAEVDLDQMIWRSPGVSGEAEHVPLGQGMTKALGELREENSGQRQEFVFGSTRDVAPSPVTLRKLRRTINTLMDVELARNNLKQREEWQWNDLRRSVLTMMSSLDFSYPVCCAAVGLQARGRDHKRVRQLLDAHSEALVELQSEDGPYWTAFH